MEAFAALSGQTESPPDGSPRNLLLPVPTVLNVSGDEESIDSLRDVLHAAQLRLAYFERFGPWVEEQMAAVVERATSVERETERQSTEASEDIARQRAEVAEEVERQRSEAAEEVARLREEVAEEVASIRRDAERERKEVAAEIARRRQEVDELKAECDRRREEARATIAHAHMTAEFVMGRLSESAGGIVQRAVADLETLRAELTPEGLVAMAMSVPVPTEPEYETTPDDDASADERRRGWLPFVK